MSTVIRLSGVGVRIQGPVPPALAPALQVVPQPLYLWPAEFAADYTAEFSIWAGRTLSFAPVLPLVALPVLFGLAAAIKLWLH